MSQVKVGVDMLRMLGGDSHGCDIAWCWYWLAMEMVEVVAAVLVLVLVTVCRGTCSLM